MHFTARRRLESRTLLIAALACLAQSTVALANISDSFGRPDAAALGNGWIEKNAAAFTLEAGEVAKQATSGAISYRDNIVYRPSAEDVLDVEASVELRLTNAAVGYPQMLVRVQSASVSGANVLDGYMLYLNNSATQAILGRQSGNAFVTALATFNLSTALDTANRYRLRLRATGTNPVQLDAFVERLNGSAWNAIGTTQVIDSDPDRIATAGSVGFSGYVESFYIYDNFVRINLSGSPTNPIPLASSLSPSSAAAGENGLTLTVFGSGFVPGSAVRWNGADRATTVVSSTELEAAITPADLATEGTANVTVFNPAPGGGSSGPLAFTIGAAPAPNPTPVASALSPSSVVAGASQFTLIVTGSNFASTATVRWNGATRTTTFVSPTELRATILAGDVGAQGSATVTAFNPAPGGGVSNGLTFTIQPPPNPVPVLSALIPSSTTAGSPGFTLVLNGTGFINGSVVRWNGSNRTTQFVSATELRATVSSGDIASSGTRQVTVFSPAPGGGTSNSLTFTIQSAGGGNPAPFIGTLAPTSAVAGSGSVQVTINGAGFTTASVARYNGSNRTTTWVSSAQMRVTLTAADTANAGHGAITVQTPAPGGGTTQPMTFFVVQSGNQVFFDGFNRADSATLGNNWTEKSATAFSIQNNEIVSIATAYDYHDSITYRPVSEDRRDVELGIEFRRTAGNDTFPQLHARVQRNSVTLADTIESYIFFIDDFASSPGRAIIAAQPPETGRYECYMLAIPLPSALVEGQRYRLRFRVTGVVPVVLTGFVDRYNGTNWQLLASGTLNHDSNTQMVPDLPCYPGVVPTPITSAGTNGFAKWETQADVYDNFYWMDAQGGGSTAPLITSLSPGTVVAGNGIFTLTVNGGNFAGNSVVRWNGSPRTTTYVSPTRVTAAIPASDVAAPGTASVTVFNPTNGAESTAENFSIAAPVQATFTDNFDRPDSGAVGNGWIEKNASAFALATGAVTKLSTSGGYRDNLVYRPASEDLLNSESSIELRLLGAGAPGYPQVLTRVQTSTAGLGDTIDSYILYVNNSTTQAVLGRQRNTQFVSSLATINLSAALVQGQTYRLRVSATGSNPVRVTGFVERRDGSAWTVLGSAVADDTSVERLTQPGSVGFSGYVESGYVYDNFTRSELP